LQAKVAGIFPLILAGLADAHRATYPERAKDYGPSLRGMLDYAMTIQGMDVAAAINQANNLRGEFAALFTEIDLLLVPVLTHPTPEAGAIEKALGANPAVTADMARFTTPFNITGQPTITLRGGSDDRRLPIGFQLVGRPFEEELLFRAGHAFQRATDWHAMHPSLDWIARSSKQGPPKQS
jgi:amidase